MVDPFAFWNFFCVEFVSISVLNRANSGVDSHECHYGYMLHDFVRVCTQCTGRFKNCIPSSISKSMILSLSPLSLAVQRQLLPLVLLRPQPLQHSALLPPLGPLLLLLVRLPPPLQLLPLLVKHLHHHSDLPAHPYSANLEPPRQDLLVLLYLEPPGARRFSGSLRLLLPAQA